MTETVTWSCRCGATALEVEISGGSRVMCYCTHCQAFARHFGRTDMLDAHGGSDLYQVAPHQVRFLRGEENLAAIRLTDKGPMRWYAACCDTPMANTWPSPALPFVTMTAVRFDAPDALPRLHAQTFRRDGIGYVEREGGNVARVYFDFARRAIVSRLTGRWKENPFFGADGAPKARYRRLSEDEMKAAYDAEQTV